MKHAPETGAILPMLGVFRIQSAQGEALHA
jgi:hypothetical protein